MTAKGYLEQHIGDGTWTRLQAEIIANWMEEYANQKLSEQNENSTCIVNLSNVVRAQLCLTCDDKKRIKYFFDQDDTAEIDCPDCNGGDRERYKKLEKRMADCYNL